MRVLQFKLLLAPHQIRLGLEEKNGIVDISHIAASTLDLIRGGSSLLEEVEHYLKSSPPVISVDQVVFQAPITGMDKVLCVGMNYRDHCAEQNAPVPTEPVIFNKFPSCVVGPTADIQLPACTNLLDWEVELVVVIGKKTFQVSEEAAMDSVFGYTVANDLSARDWQMKRNGGQWLVGKSMDAFCPLGPVILTRDSLEDPHALNLSCHVNGVTKQNSSTSQLVFGVPAIISWISQFSTLLPGDIILTGTPPGVGVFMKPPQHLKAGDVVECTVQGVGTIRNRIVAS